MTTVNVAKKRSAKRQKSHLGIGKNVCFGQLFGFFLGGLFFFVCAKNGRDHVQKLQRRSSQFEQGKIADN